MIKALFLDRDGIINVDKGYLYKTEDIEFVDGIFQFLKTASGLGFEFFVITNQSGVARGMYQLSDIDTVHRFMAEKLKEKGADIKNFYFCPHHPDVTGRCECRKPETGMIKEALADYKIDLKSSVIIGDKKSDVLTGKNAGIGCTILVKSRYQNETIPEADFFVNDLFEAEKVLKDYCGV